MSNNNQPLIQTLKGFRDFLPDQKRQRDFVAKKVIEVFEQFAFEPLETPTLEYASLLLGKYGEEADKLVYSFVDSGNRQVGLRYDQTVPTARVLAQYQNELPKFFRRYQIQNVFRADKPQKGRYREFTQCDLDIFNSQSPVADAEIVACTYFSFLNVGYPKIIIKINDRQTLFNSLGEFATDKVNVFSIIQSIDKLDKMSGEAVVEELVSKGLQAEKAKAVLQSIDLATQSENLQQIIQNVMDLGVPKDSLVFTPSLARGLDYYTGMIFEMILPGYDVGSCGGGGRYDNLIEELGGVDVPAVGVAFGFDRMVEAAEMMNLIAGKSLGAQAMVTIFGSSTLANSLQVANQLRASGIKTEVYPATEDKLAKQFKLANKKNIPWVVVVGEEEIDKNLIGLKNMQSGEQQQLSLEEAIEQIKQ